MEELPSEANNGTRLSWNVIPTDRASAQRLSVPIGCIYTPFKPLETILEVAYKPALCTRATCGAIANPYARVLSAKSWMCAFCNQVNQFSDQHPGAATSIPPEFSRNVNTLEYSLDNNVSPPIFIFVIDLAMIKEELAALKAGILQAMLLLPPEALVSIITFGTDIHIFELGFKPFPKSYCIPGATTITTQAISELLGLRVPVAVSSAARAEQKGPDMPSYPGAAINDGRTRFIQPFGECESQVTMILEDLESDPWRSPPSARPARCTGTAIAAALCLLDATYKTSNARVLAFVGGAATVGMGAVAPTSLATPIRSHKDIERDEAPFVEPATKFYSQLAAMAGTNGHIVDLFVGCLDQVGLYEMQNLVTHTGGHVVLDDSFTRGVFQGSLRKLFAVDPDDNNHLAMAFSAEVVVMTSKEIKVQGASGHLVSMQRKSSCVADTSVAVGGTCAWRMGGLDHSSSIALFFDIAAAPAAAVPPQALVQIATRYRHASGRKRLRITTIAIPMRDLKDPESAAMIYKSFDQEAAAALVTRYMISRSATDSPTEICRLIDRMLIRFSACVGNYTKGDPASFKFDRPHLFFPQFMFHLRRSQFVQLFNNSPDETVFFKSIGSREDCNNTLPMIQPTLTSFTPSEGAKPVALDTSAMHPGCILLLDTFFHIVVWYGSQIVQWRNDINSLSEDARPLFVQLLNAPLEEARQSMRDRFPTPRFIECVEGGSQARFLVAKLDHSRKTNAANGSLASQLDGPPGVFTDDVSLSVFLSHLSKVAVQNDF